MEFDSVASADLFFCAVLFFPSPSPPPICMCVCVYHVFIPIRNNSVTIFLSAIILRSCACVYLQLSSIQCIPTIMSFFTRLFRFCETFSNNNYQLIFTSLFFNKKNKNIFSQSTESVRLCSQVHVGGASLDPTPNEPPPSSCTPMKPGSGVSWTPLESPHGRHSPSASSAAAEGCGRLGETPFFKSRFPSLRRFLRGANFVAVYCNRSGLWMRVYATLHLFRACWETRG